MIRIAFIEDNLDYRSTLSRLLLRNPDIEIIYESDNSLEAVPYFEVELPDVVIMDIDLPEKSGIETVWELKKKWPDLKILMLTVFEEPDKIFGAIKAGANGYLLKKDPPNKIMDALFELKNGESIMNGIIAAKVMEYFKKQSDALPKIGDYHLTRKETDILEKLVEGHGYKMIASLVSITTDTLNTHIKNIYRKLNVHSRAEIAARFGNNFQN